MVELGPSSTLVGMARKTIQGQIAAGRRVADGTQLLASTQHMGRLSYQYEHPPIFETSPVLETASTAIVPQQAALASQNDVSTTVLPLRVVAEIPDVPIHAADIVRALIARKLKKPMVEISVSRSLKELCNGKSTLQNELVGDLHTEFGSLPYAPEDLSLTALGEATMATAKASDAGIPLGKTSTTILVKLVSAKMPPNASVKVMRTYLAEQWGLKKGRQNAVLLFVMTSEPEARLTSEKAVHQYLDGVTNMYAAWSGLTLQASSAEVGIKIQQTAELADPAAAAQFMSSNHKLARKQYEALAQFLAFGDTPADADPQFLVTQLQSKLDCWTSEFSEDFLAWISPSFDIKKARRYNAYWRSARQELLQFYDLLLTDRLASSTPEIWPFSALLIAMANKADDELATIARTRGRQLRTHHGHKLTVEARAQLQILEKAITGGITLTPRAHPALNSCYSDKIVSLSDNNQKSEPSRYDTPGKTDYAKLISRTTLLAGSIIDIRAAVRVRCRDQWPADVQLTDWLLATLSGAMKTGISFSGKQVLVTGAGENSIGAAVIRLLLAGGARVIVTTSRTPSSVAQSFQRMYEVDGARDSELILFPFNQGSIADCDQLIDHIFDPQGMDRDLDAILPFAAIPEGGTELDEIGARSEFAHRLMSTNILRLLGRVIGNKRARGIDTNPTQVILPLSPNHGAFGGDGLYSESKLGLESLLRKVQSESWHSELSICGVNIGWTRSTGLMNQNDIVAATVEQHGVLTFSIAEMALNIAVLMTSEMREMCEGQTPIVDFSGGLGQLEDCHIILAEARKAIRQEAAIAKAIEAEDEREHGTQYLDDQKSAHRIRARTTLHVGFPSLPDYMEEVQPLQHGLPAQADPASTVVIVGFSELGPLGSARSRWEWESRGRFGTAALVELAWMMGLITHVNEPRKEGQYVGWVDVKTRETVLDDEIEQRYGDHICKHTGIRALDPDIVGYDPKNKESLEEISIADDLEAYETSLAVAKAFKRRHGVNVHIQISDEGDRCRVRFRRGATVMVPKATEFRWGGVAGQLPSGFDASRYGVPEDLVRQLDPVSLYAVCCVAEAFYSAGMPDPLELFKHIHPSEIGNFIGTSMGGALKTRHLYKDMFLGKTVDSDTLQDTYANTTAAWVNMLLLGSVGPIKTPVGACATGVESVDSGFESIMSGKTRVCIVGGVDDLQEDEAYGFALLKATANAEEELAKGRLPSEMSRPTAESRAGFVEAHGCGVQLLCRADLAIEMGLPIYGIVAGSAMAADGVSRSVPAPGQGILTFARETLAGATPESSVRVEEQDTSSDGMSRNSSAQSSNSDTDGSTTFSGSSEDGYEYETPFTPPEHFEFGMATNAPNFEQLVHRASPSPLRAALARWGLSIDDIGLASLHGTSTKANDTNEPEVLCVQMDHLGRTRAKPMWAICQKAVTGHPKAPAAAWMLNGCLQALQSRCIPGNRNADNIDPAWRNYDHLCLPTTPVHTEIQAFMLTSFGFGQKGGQMIGVAPKYLFATQSHAMYKAYARRAQQRCEKADREYAKALMEHKVVRVLETSPWSKGDARTMLLDPMARLGPNGTITTSAGPRQQDSQKYHDNPDITAHVRRAIQQTSVGSAALPLGSKHNVRSVGIDMVCLTDFDSHLNETFIERNFTPAEVASATAHVDVRAAFAGRWCAKEAVFKSLRTRTQGAGAAMKMIEILTHDGGMPEVAVSVLEE